MKNHWLVFFLFYTSVFSQQKTIGEFSELIIKDGLLVTNAMCYPHAYKYIKFV